MKYVLLILSAFIAIQKTELQKNSIVPYEIEQYKNGVFAQERGDWDSAIQYFDSVQPNDHFLYPFAQIRIAQCKSSQGNLDEAIRILTAILTPTSHNEPWFVPASLTLSLWLAKKGATIPLNNESGLRLIDESIFIPWWLIPTLFDLGSVLIQSKQQYEQGSKLLQYVVKYGGYNPQRKNALLNLCSSPADKDRAFAIQYLIRNGYLSESWFLLKSLISPTILTYVFSPNEKEKWDEFPTKSDDFVKEWIKQQQSAYATAVFEYVIRTLIYLNKTDVADSLIQKLNPYLPAEFDYGEYLCRAGAKAEQSNDENRMVYYYTALHTKFPEHKFTAQAIFALANWFYNKGNYEWAKKYFLTVIEQYKTSAYFTRSIYYLGKIFESEGDSQKATELYQKAIESNIGDYYAHCIAKQLHQSNPETIPFTINVIKSQLPVASIKTRWNAQSKLDKRVLLPVMWNYEELVESIQNDIPMQWLFHLARLGVEEAEWVAYHLCGQVATGQRDVQTLVLIAHSGCAQTVWDYLYASKNREKTIDLKESQRLQIYFPLPFYHEVTRYAKEMDMDPFLIWSVMRQESTYRTSVISTAGARGLLQLIPSTAQWIKKKDIRIAEKDPNLWKYPDVNIAIGTAYLSYLMELYDKNIVFTLAGYNAGPGRVKEWRKKNFKDLEEFIETIPFNETNNYVKKVLGNYAGYLSIYPKSISSPK